ncbi:MAG: hypothetical protein OES57_03265 [Acidimicrobiia bacterium]|nr:hypothetical protein [Acidimicrobiia bacterium]
MRRPHLALFAVALVVAAACSSDADSATVDASSTSSPETSATVSSTTAAPPSTPSTNATNEASATPTAAEVVGADPDVAAEMQRVAGTAEDGPFYMVNLLDFHDELADYPPDSEFYGSTGREANDRYSEVVLPALASIGATPVYVGAVERSLIPGEVEWEQIGIVHYPSRAALLEMSAQPDFVAGSVHKDASLANTFAMVTDRLELPESPPVDPASLPHPPTDDDPGFMMVHVIDFHDEARYEPGDEPDDAPISGEEAVQRYSLNAGVVAAPLGVRPRAWFDVQGALLGDHQRWEQVRLNEFPSVAAFDTLTSDSTWQSGSFHRTAGINETYALMTRPLVYDRSFGEPAP